MHSAKNLITILIADDHQLFSDGLKKLLTYQDSPYTVIAQLYSGIEVVPTIHQYHPDVLLLDINLPGRTGIDIARQVVREFPAVRVVIITMYSYQKFVKDLQRIGVAGYLLKNATQHELITCLQQVVAGKTYFDDRLYGQGGNLHDEDEFVRRHHLSPREVEIIRLLKQGLSAADIAEWLYLSEETVKTHRKNIYYKLHINSIAQLIQFANEHGL